LANNNKDEISASEFSKFLDSNSPVAILDVREREEFELTRLENSTLIPVMEVEDNLELIQSLRTSDEIPLVVLCRSGGRSMQITEVLLSQGFTNVLNLIGGINELSKFRDELKAY